MKIQTDMKLAEEAAAKLREESEKIDAIIRNIQANKGLVTRQARQALAQPAAAEPKKPPAAARQRSRPKARGASPAATVDTASPRRGHALGRAIYPATHA